MQTDKCFENYSRILYGDTNSIHSLIAVPIVIKVRILEKIEYFFFYYIQEDRIVDTVAYIGRSATIPLSNRHYIHFKEIISV